MLQAVENLVFKNSELHSRFHGENVCKATLQNENITIDVTNLGCSILSIFAPDKNGVKKNIVAGFTEITDYTGNPYYFGCVLGRYANRIANGKFTLDGESVTLSVNNEANQLHGGFEGFNKKVWKINSFTRYKDKASVEFEYDSKDGEEGYPGNASIKVKYTLNNASQLIITYSATTDKATPINLSNHSYFNLTGFENPVITDHVLYINAENYTEKNEHNVPTGRILPVLNSPLDFTGPAKIGAHIKELPADKGYDHNFVLQGYEEGKMVLAAQLQEPVSGRLLRVYTSQPGIQLYTANFWDGSILGQQNTYYQQHGAVALETQAFPDSPNHPSFPSTILRPGEQYSSTTIYEFGVE